MEEEKKKGLTLFHYPDSILVFLKLFVGFASDGGDSNTETAPCLGTSHLTREGHKQFQENQNRIWVMK